MAWLSLLLLIFLFPLSSAHPQTVNVKLSLRLNAATPSPWQKLRTLAANSASRAHHLKHRNAVVSSSNVALFPRNYGGYLISFGVGTPPQHLSFIFDTGSSLVWFPCTRRYICSSCNFDEVNPPVVFSFNPKLSSSWETVNCRNPKCAWVFPNVNCGNCSANFDQVCPSYMVQYGSGSTLGQLLSETLVFPESSVKNFLVGCSVFSSNQPAGIAGFGRGPASLPAQLGVKRFSYCMVSHDFDDKPVSSNLVLVTGGGARGGGAANYTPFRKNPNSLNPTFEDYYYVYLWKITVGGIDIKTPYKFRVADSDGHGGMIVDTGTTFTYMEKEIFESLAKEFEKQIKGNYSRATDIESRSGLRPCLRISGQGQVEIPKLSFHFKGGARMDLPLADYFSLLNDSVLCMTIVTSSAGAGKGGSPGPAIILGNYQQQNMYMEFDLENERLGFEARLCNKG